MNTVTPFKETSNSEMKENIEMKVIGDKPRASTIAWEEQVPSTLEGKPSKKVAVTKNVKIFNEALSKYLTKIPSLIDFDILDANSKITPKTSLFGAVLIVPCFFIMMTAIFAESPENIVVLGEVGGAIQVKIIKIVGVQLMHC